MEGKSSHLSSTSESANTGQTSTEISGSKVPCTALSGEASVLPEAEGPSEAAVEKYANVRCLDLGGEWRRCISAYNQFHQYYIHGQFSLCKQEKARMYNCFRWRALRDEKARRALIRSLEEEELNMRPPTPLWEMRKSPPSDWKK